MMQMQAAGTGDEGEVARLLDEDPSLLDGREDYEPPILVAAESGHLGVVRLLVQRGANLNATEYRDITALHLAVSQGNEEVVAFLLQQGAQANRRTMNGHTPLMWAARHSDSVIMEMLVKHLGGQGLDDKDGTAEWTPLHNAADWGEQEAVRVLLLAGADPSIVDNEGRTPRAVAEETVEEEDWMDEQEKEHREEGRAGCVAVFQVSGERVLI
jgi:hypothetical protein